MVTSAGGHGEEVRVGRVLTRLAIPEQQATATQLEQRLPEHVAAD
jgi:hypothetical protein